MTINLLISFRWRSGHYERQTANAPVLMFGIESACLWSMLPKVGVQGTSGRTAPRENEETIEIGGEVGSCGGDGTVENSREGTSIGGVTWRLGVTPTGGGSSRGPRRDISGQTHVPHASSLFTRTSKYCLDSPGPATQSK